MKCDEPNPYQSPTIAEVATAKAIRRQKSRWRIIPVILLLIYGICMVVAGAAATVSYAILAIRHGDFAEFWLGTHFWPVLCFSGLSMSSGVLLIFTAMSLWKARWSLAGCAFAFAVVFGFVAWTLQGAVPN
jgi:hypothetical protein